MPLKLRSECLEQRLKDIERVMLLSQKYLSPDDWARLWSDVASTNLDEVLLTERIKTRLDKIEEQAKALEELGADPSLAYEMFRLEVLSDWLDMIDSA